VALHVRVREPFCRSPPEIVAPLHFTRDSSKDDHVQRVHFAVGEAERHMKPSQIEQVSASAKEEEENLDVTDAGCDCASRR
jgi:hypothetical protein